MTPNTEAPKEKKGMSKSQYAKYVCAVLARDGSKLIRVNWNKRTVHYTDLKGNKRTKPCWGVRQTI